MKFGHILIIALVAVVQAKKDLPGENDREAKIVRAYEAMNKYLEKRVDMNDVNTIVAEAKRSLKFMPFLKSKYLIKAYRSFVGFAQLVDNKNCTVNAGDFFRMNDIGADDSHLEPNHKLRPIDLVIQHYGYKYLNLCYLGFYRQTKFTFKENHYQQVNEILSESGDADEVDVQKDMRKIGYLYDKSLMEDPHGAMTATYYNIIQLKETLDPEYCDHDRGFEIILRNNLGVSHHDFWKVGRVDAMVDHYTQEHSKMCHKTYPSKFDLMMIEIDTSLFKSLLTISGSFFVDRHILEYLNTNTISNYDDLKNNLLEKTNLKALNENKEWEYLTTGNAELKGLDFYRFLKDLSKKQAIDFKAYNIADLFNRNLREPCKMFMRKAGDLYKRMNYVIKNLGGLYGKNEEEFKPWVGVYFFTPAFRACRQVDNFPDVTIDRILEAMQPKTSVLYPYGYNRVITDHLN